jgi:hypothetical protein
LDTSLIIQTFSGRKKATSKMHYVIIISTYKKALNCASLSKMYYNTALSRLPSMIEIGASVIAINPLKVIIAKHYFYFKTSVPLYLNAELLYATFV